MSVRPSRSGKITTSTLGSFAIKSLKARMPWFANRAIRKATPDQVPGPFLNVVELIVESLDGMVAGSMGAVSYTHLDVYKRQVQ